MSSMESWQPLADTLGFTNEEEMLQHLYIQQGFSFNELRTMLGYSTFAIRARLAKYNIPFRTRGGPANRTGRRRLKHLTDEQLAQIPAVRIAEQHRIHISTVYAEIRLREKEKHDAVLRHYASQGVSTVRSAKQNPHGSGSASGDS